MDIFTENVDGLRGSQSICVCVRRERSCSILKANRLEINVQVLTVFNTHETIFGKFQSRWTRTRNFRTAFDDLRCGQTQMRTMAVHGEAMIDTIGLPIRMIDVYSHRVLQLKYRIVVQRMSSMMRPRAPK